MARANSPRRAIIGGALSTTNTADPGMNAVMARLCVASGDRSRPADKRRVCERHGQARDRDENRAMTPSSLVTPPRLRSQPGPRCPRLRSRGRFDIPASTPVGTAALRRFSGVASAIARADAQRSSRNPGKSRGCAPRGRVAPDTSMRMPPTNCLAVPLPVGTAAVSRLARSNLRLAAYSSRVKRGRL
jgi:hypothetical protein